MQLSGERVDSRQDLLLGEQYRFEIARYVVGVHRVPPEGRHRAATEGRPKILPRRGKRGFRPSL
ncbi:hypothetical protein Ato02nite_070180 [Paractinoplanes toevensis]|uniref:Uncharacterized protein n=1 Tax=Paractinoplanes toevensis TaxID=571911 RepID=A0A919W6S9_9ACTN|nr:hypothetical protein Ato02nite_070180 [Actinoplanes toevensis]